MKFPSGWYVIATVRELSPTKMNPLRRFGRDWIVRRTSEGQWIAQEDRCPHRSAKLSLGKLEHGCVSCPFHGFRFDDSGRCTWVPEIAKAAPGLQVETVPLSVSQGFLWFPMEAPSTTIPWFEELDSKSFSHSWSKHRWMKHFTRCVENQLDYAHLPYIHRTSIGRGFDPAIQARFELNDRSLKVVLGQKPGDSSYFEFRFGNIWKLNISGSFKQTIAFVPVDEGETLLYLRTYHRFTRVPLLRDLLAWLLAPLNYVILQQDHAVVMTQEPGDSLSADEEVLFGSDKAIRAFRSWLKSAA